jgi:hypothetical protein
MGGGRGEERRTLQLFPTELLLVEGEERGREDGRSGFVFRVVVGCETGAGGDGSEKYQYRKVKGWEERGRKDKERR